MHACHRHQRQRSGLIARYALRVCLVLSLWHAPLPWFHVHAVEAAVVAQTPWLAEHVEEFHAELLEQTTASLGWHVHLVLPWNATHKGDCDGRSDGRHGSGQSGDEGSHFVAALKYSVPCTSPSAVAAIPPVEAGLPLAATDLVRDAEQFRPPAPGASFLATFLGSVALCDLLDRYVC